MEFRPTQTINRQTDFSQYETNERDNQLVQRRLTTLLALNAETARKNAVFASEQESIEAELMNNPQSLEQIFSKFGLILGIFTPAAIFLKFSLDTRIEPWIFGIMLIINLITATVGFFSGKLISKAIRSLEQLSWSAMLLLLPFVGLVWGMMTGGAGGLIVFGVGAFFGAFFASFVSIPALTIFTMFHRLLKKGEMIENKHFLPLAFGITFTICGFIFGL